MAIDINQLTVNVNLHTLQPGFLNSELYYVIALDEQTFRFADVMEEPGVNEEKFYCFLTEQDLYIPAGSITLEESYVITREPAYPVLKNGADFINVIQSLPRRGVAKAIRKFPNEQVDVIQQALIDKFGTVEKHLVQSREGQHLLFVVNTIIDISLAANMVYFRYRNQA